ncbi:MAG: LPS assembly protein LptD [Puniceicoccales bacterium]|nr:LPS assembly protein LptD [Puniceicoccales bacterium]
MEALKKSVILIYFSYFLAAFGDNSQGIRIDIGSIKIGANHLIFKDPLVHVSGKVCITSNDFYGRCKALDYDIHSKNIHAHDINIATNRGYASAKEAYITQEQIVLEDADIGLNAGTGSIIPHMETKRMIYDCQRRKGTAQLASLKIGNIPLVAPPITVGDWIRSVDMHLNVGHTSKLGGYFHNEILYNIYKDFRLGALLNAYTKRGVLMGPVIKVDSEGESIKSHLNLQIGHIADRGDRNNRGEDVDGTSIEKKRWFIDAKQNHHFGQNIDVLSNLLWASDGKIMDDFRLGGTEDSDIRDSFGELDYRGEKDLLTLFTRVKMNRYQDFSQQIPSIRLERFPQEIFDSGIYYFGHIDFTRQKSTKKKLTISEQQEAIELSWIDNYWGINRPIELDNGIYFTPLSGGKWVHYCEGQDQFLGEIGFDSDINFYALYPESILWLKAKEWKHIIRPTIKYRYFSPIGKYGKNGIDRQPKNDFFPVLELAEMRNMDNLLGQSILRLGLENDFFAKSEKNKIRQIASLDFYQDLNLKRCHDASDRQCQMKKLLSDFYIFSELNPRRWLNLRLYSRLDWEHFSIRTINAETNFLSGDLWELGLRKKFVRHHSDQFGINFCFRFDEVSRLGLEAQIDGKSGKLLATKISYTMRWDSVWDVKLFCKIKNHSSRDSRFQPGFSINLIDW